MRLVHAPFVNEPSSFETLCVRAKLEFERSNFKIDNLGDSLLMQFFLRESQKSVGTG